jgi:peptidyl-prolyl cis-trans isomerase B (cyclophilin B)
MPAAQVLMTTTVGPITLELDADNAPKTVENFLSYVSNGFYDGTIFHRVIDNFMIQIETDSIMDQMISSGQI